MSVLDSLKRRRNAMSHDIASGALADFSALQVTRMRMTREAIAAHARGAVLDVGCGHMPFRADALRHATRYDGFDAERRVPDVTYVGDAEQMTAVGDAAYDTVFCFEVLEHLPHPQAALREMARVLAPGGTLLITVPHLSRLHEEPHDYFRYTDHGLRRMLADTGLEVKGVERMAGLFGFLAHQASTLLLASTYGIPLVAGLSRVLNRLVLVWPALALDAVIDRRGLFAQGWLAVAVKPPR